MVLIRDFLWFVLFLPTFFLVGHVMLSRPLAGSLGRLSYLWLAVTTGMLSTSLLAFALGLLHVFTTTTVVMLLVFFWLVFCAKALYQPAFVAPLRVMAHSFVASVAEGWRKAPILTTLLAFVLGLAFLACGTPEVRGDPIIYHITEAWLYVLHRGHVEIPSSALTYIPQNQQLLYALALSLGSDSLAKSWHWLQGALLLIGTAMLTRYLGVSRKGSIAAAVIVAVCPMWFYLATTTYIDLAVANYLLACIYLLLVATDEKSGTSATLGAAGVFAGGALGCKYTAGIVGFVPALVALLDRMGFSERRSFRESFRRVLLFSIATFVVFLPWLLRNWLWTGNPIAPSFMRQLGPKGVPESTLSWPDILAIPAEPVNSPFLLLRAYILMFFSLSDFGNFLPTLGLVVGGIGSVLPETRRRFWSPEIRFLVLFLAVAFLLGVPTAALRRDSRYIMAHVAILAGVIVYWFEQLQAALAGRRRLLGWIGAAAISSLAVSGAVQVYLRLGDLNETILPIFDAHARDEYCQKRLSNYQANRELAKYADQIDGQVLGAAYPAPVPYVLGGAPLRHELLVQRVNELEPKHLAGLWRMGVRYLFGEVRSELLPHLELVGDCHGVHLWRIRHNSPALHTDGRAKKSGLP